MEPDDGQDEDSPVFAWLPPEDRLWRHPSEVGAARASSQPPVASRRISRARPLGTTICAGMIGALVAIGVAMATGFVGRHTVIDPVPVPSPDTAALTSSTPATPGDWAAIADALAPSLVALRVVTSGGVEQSSGVIYTAGDDRTYILTAADVASTGTSMTAVFADGGATPAHVLGVDPGSGIALLWVRGELGSVPTLGSVSNLSVADPVLAVGARTADSTPVGTGAVTGVDQQLDLEGGSTLYGMLAVSDVSIPDTADGGAIVDGSGEVIGIATDLTSVDTGEQGLTFAVPINTAVHVVGQILKGRRPSQAWIGIDDATDLSTATAQVDGAPNGGAVVGAVAPGGPAAADGIVPGDVVTAFDGQPVESSGVLVMLLALCQPGQQTSITYVADRQRHTAAITVGVEPTFSG